MCYMISVSALLIQWSELYLFIPLSKEGLAFTDVYQRFYKCISIIANENHTYMMKTDI